MAKTSICSLRLHSNTGHLPPPALGEDPVLTGALVLPAGAAGAPLAGGTTASRPAALPRSLPGIPCGEINDIHLFNMTWLLNRPYLLVILELLL